MYKSAEVETAILSGKAREPALRPDLGFRRRQPDREARGAVLVGRPGYHLFPCSSHQALPKELSSFSVCDTFSSVSSASPLSHFFLHGVSVCWKALVEIYIIHTISNISYLIIFSSLQCFSFDSQYNHSETLRMNTQNATRTRKESIRDTHCDEQNQEPR